MARPQTFKNHTRFDPYYHFSLVPVLVLNLVIGTIWAIRHRRQFPHLSFWVVAVAVVLLYIAVKVRLYALKNQDRVIRLEERLRLAALLPAAEVGLAHKLTTKQLIALRFASDIELPVLARRAMNENLDPRIIKKSIRDWRPDYHRI